jgi:hypothetical protein
MIELELDEGEMYLAGGIGVMRALYALRTGRVNPAGLQRRTIDKSSMVGHFFGACGEQALAKHLGVYWDGTIGTVDAPCDVGGCYQVKATDLALGKLITKRKDNDRQPFVLARVSLPKVTLVGWLWGYETKKEQNWREDVAEPAFFSWPLHDMKALPSQAAVKAFMQSSVA